MAPTLLEIAEAPGAFVLPPHPSVVTGDGYLTLPRGPGLLTVQRVRLAPGRVEAARAEIRTHARDVGAERIEWALCELSEPARLAERLALERTETLAVLALTSTPAPGGAFAIRQAERFLVWVAFEGDRAVGMARCAACADALVMIGGAVLPDERGRGVYRALVAARWETAIERGSSALVTAANEQSAPILRRVGFAELGEIDVYEETV